MTVTDQESPHARTSSAPDRTALGAGRVGSGRDFGADVYALYRAGRIYFPDVAERYARWTWTAHDFEQRAHYLHASVGGRPALAAVSEARASLADGLRHTAITMREVGEALVATAADFAGTDAEANAEFHRLLARHDRVFAAPTPHLPDPPGRGAPYRNVYRAPSLVDSQDDE